jgi:hypothetical protein
LLTASLNPQIDVRNEVSGWKGRAVRDYFEGGLAGNFSKTLRIEPGVVKQIVDDVKSSYSAGTMLIADELLRSIAHRKQATQFSAPEDWVFASPAKLGRQPLSHTHVWGTLDRTRKEPASTT